MSIPETSKELSLCFRLIHCLLVAPYLQGPTPEDATSCKVMTDAGVLRLSIIPGLERCDRNPLQQGKRVYPIMLS